MKERLSIKERKFFEAYLDTGSLADAAKKAGYNCKNRHSFNETGRQILKRIAPTLDDVMEHMGVTDALVVKKIREGLNAKETKFATYKGVITDKLNVTDYGTRAKYVDIVTRVKGMAKPEKHEVTGEGGAPLLAELSDSLKEMVSTIVSGI